MNVKVKKFIQALVNGGSNYDSRSRLINSILDGKADDPVIKPDPSIVAAWGNSFETSLPLREINNMKSVPLFKTNVWVPITCSELESVRGHMREAAAGPDGLTVAQLKKIPASVLCKVLNLLMVHGHLPEFYELSRTTLIPKVVDPKAASDFRPISVASVLVRFLHKILAKRLTDSVQLDIRQRGFVPVDGCAENIHILESIISNAKQHIKSAYI